MATFGEFLRKEREIKGFNLTNHDEKQASRSYYAVVDSMKTGDVIPFRLIRNGKKMNLDIEVGAISHAGYSLKIGK